MATREDLVWRLETLLKDLRAAEQKDKKLSKDRHVSEAERQFYAKIYAEDIQTCKQRIIDTMEYYDSFPERFHEYTKLEADFRKENPDSDFSSSVFVMTKFPIAGQPGADQLQAVIDCLQQAIAARGYHPRIAQGPTFKEWLWSNVEMHLLFCKCGVAILENRYLSELNPNVAMEWGWMLGMGRRVIYLREKDFSKERADWLGRISYEFDWEQPAAGIEAAIQQDLPRR